MEMPDSYSYNLAPFIRFFLSDLNVPILRCNTKVEYVMKPQNFIHILSSLLTEVPVFPNPVSISLTSRVII